MTQCLDASLLERLNSGPVSDEEIQEVVLHSEQCAACRERVEGLSKLTRLVEAVRAGVSALDMSDNSTLEILLQRVRGLPAANTPVAASDTAIPTLSGLAGLDKSLTALLAPAQAPDELGRLGKYRVLKVLGAGGMGVVFQAEDPELRRPVALKVMLPSVAAHPAAKARFLREARTMAAVKHDHIVTIFEVGETDGVPFLAMEYLKGETLEKRLQREGKLSPMEVLRIGREIVAGLAAAHARGMIHRDIKPGNLWLEESGRVKILDFGLAREIADAEVGATTQAVLGAVGVLAAEEAEVVHARNPNGAKERESRATDQHIPTSTDRQR
ncbi:MAG: serine/threonine protein kinase [Gemmataceae bacterium]|nr:serine/threonine protein kinase [Gemmataceae bacterium]